jgi:hypothetical protein
MENKSDLERVLVKWKLIYFVSSSVQIYETKRPLNKVLSGLFGRNKRKALSALKVTHISTMGQ